MKKIIYSFLAGITALGCICATGKKQYFANAETTLTQSKSAYLCDAESGTVAYESNATQRLPIASMCKIMTLLLSFEAIDSGTLSFYEEVQISEHAASMGGSQVFLQSSLSYPANELMKTIAVCSANDSCVAMAERVAGNEDLFVEKMNERAKELGAENTLFANCTGLPKEPQYSCAKDVALMLGELIKHEKYFEYSKVWLEDFKHPDGRTTRITNTNKLSRFYDGCDGGKTGFTNQAGFCLAATAKRGDMRVISVVIGAEDSKTRFNSVSNLFNYAFANYQSKRIVEAGKPLDQQVSVRGSKKQSISVYSEQTLSIFQKKGEEKEYTTKYDFEKLSAPVLKQDKIGEITVYCDGVECGKCSLLAAEEAQKLNWAQSFEKAANHWN